jgi:hypothetical protein
MHIQRRMLLIASLFLIPVIAAYVQSSIFGLPPIARNSTRSPNNGGAAWRSESNPPSQHADSSSSLKENHGKKEESHALFDAKGRVC